MRCLHPIPIGLYAIKHVIIAKKAIICAQKYEYFLTNAEFHLEYSHAHFIVKNIYHISNKEKDDTALEIELHFLPLQS